MEARAGPLYISTPQGGLGCLRRGYFQRFAFKDGKEHLNSPTLGVNLDSGE